MYERLHQKEAASPDDVVGVRLSGTLTAEDYARLRAYLEEKAEAHAPLRVLILMEDWHGWDSLTALWEDLKLDAQFNRRVERLAMVGEARWERWLTTAAKPLAEGKLRYFDRGALAAAWAWVREEGRPPA